MPLWGYSCQVLKDIPCGKRKFSCYIILLNNTDQAIVLCYLPVLNLETLWKWDKHYDGAWHQYHLSTSWKDAAWYSWQWSSWQGKTTWKMLSFASHHGDFHSVSALPTAKFFLILNTFMEWYQQGWENLYLFSAYYGTRSVSDFLGCLALKRCYGPRKSSCDGAILGGIVSFCRTSEPSCRSWERALDWFRALRWEGWLCVNSFLLHSSSIFIT
jgi:hypothetical protein